MKQVQRADGLVKKMNRFAHSADEAKNFRLGGGIELVISLVQRLAAMREARVDLVMPDHPVMGVTNLFLLENIIWLCLEFFLTENHKVVKLIPEMTGRGCPDTVGCSEPWPAESSGAFPSGRETALMKL